MTPSEHKTPALALLGGRVVAKYDPAKALEIVERLAGGETLRQICKSPSVLLSPAVFRRWLVNFPDLAQAYNTALVTSAATFEEEALEEARAIAVARVDGTHVRAVEVKINQLRWSAERRDPARFGQKSAVSIRVPIQINTTLDLASDPGVVGQAGLYRVEAGPSGKPLVVEEPLNISPRGKRILTPPGANPFKETDHASIRTGSNQPSDRDGAGEADSSEPLRGRGEGGDGGARRGDDWEGQAGSGEEEVCGPSAGGPEPREQTERPAEPAAEAGAVGNGPRSEGSKGEPIQARPGASKGLWPWSKELHPGDDLRSRGDETGGREVSGKAKEDREDVGDEGISDSHTHVE